MFFGVGYCIEEVKHNLGDEQTPLFVLWSFLSHKEVSLKK